MYHNSLCRDALIWPWKRDKFRDKWNIILLAFNTSCNIIQLLHTFLDNSENYRPEVLWTTWCTIARGHKAEGESAPGRPQHRGGDSFHCCPRKVCDSCFITQPEVVFSSSSYIRRFLFNLTCSCIPEVNSRRVTFSIMQCLHTIFEKFGSSSIRYLEHLLNCRTRSEPL